jgi:putative flippase GtrA
LGAPQISGSALQNLFYLYRGYGYSLQGQENRIHFFMHSCSDCIVVYKESFLKKLLAQFMKFGIVGVIAFVIDYGFMVLLTEVFNVPYLISTTISFIISVVFNYFASMRFVFKRKDDMSRRREFIIFIVLSVIGLVINDVFMWLMVDFLYIDYRISKIVVTFIVAVWNFVTRKIFLEAKD